MDLLKDLRGRTGAPIVDCKKALQEAANNLPKAMDWLREHGAAKASSKVAGRTTLEGLVGLQIANDGQKAALVKVTSETDFAGRSALFVRLVAGVADATLHATSSVSLNDDDEDNLPLLSAQKASNGKTVQTLLDEAIVAIRENIAVADAIQLQSSGSDASRGVLVGYVHNRVDMAVPAGTAAAVVELVPLATGQATKTFAAATAESLQTAGKKLAMHIVAARPSYLTISDIPSDVLNKEKEILTKQLADSGKPADIIEKIVQGKLRKFYESVCLTEQAHMIEEGNPKISKSLAEQGIAVKRFEALSIS